MTRSTAARTARPGMRARILTVASVVIVMIAILALSSTLAFGVDDLAAYRALSTSLSGARLLAFARSAMLDYWREIPAVLDTAALPEWPGEPAGVYVSLVHGPETRACVGAPVPTRGTLAETVRSLAFEVLRADRRRPPLRLEELDDVRVVITFVRERETLANPMLVDPRTEGLLIGSPRGHVAFLPGEARTVRWALSEAKRVGILKGAGSDASYTRLAAVAIAEPQPPAPAALDRRFNSKSEEIPREHP